MNENKLLETLDKTQIPLSNIEESLKKIVDELQRIRGDGLYGSLEDIYSSLEEMKDEITVMVRLYEKNISN